MKLLTSYTLLITGFCLIVISGMVMAQDDEMPEPEYAGSRECRDCHRQIASAHGDTSHALTLVEIEEDMDPEENPVVADFAVGEDMRNVEFPDGETRPFTVDDVAFTLGAGVHIQAYLYAEETAPTEEDDEPGVAYRVFPAQWDAVNEAWITLDIAENWSDDGYLFGPNCAGCHTVGLDVTDYSWEEEAVMCESCHGPGLEHVEAADDAGGSIDDEERALIYDSINFGLDGQTCGQCHARGTSTDGIHPFPVNFYPNTMALSDVFELADPESDLFYPTGHAQLPNMQYNEALISSHPQSLTDIRDSENFSAECLSCHSVTERLIELRQSNEDIDPETIDPLAIVDANPHGVTCASCHDSHMVIEDSDDEDAEGEETTMMPPANLIQASYALCTDCHSDPDASDGVHYPTQQVFEGVSLLDNIEVDPGVHFSAEDGPTCSTCHMPNISTYLGERHSHTFNIVAPGAALDIETLQDSCSSCHDEGPEALQQLIDDIQNDTLARIDIARNAITDDTPQWVSTALDIVERDGSAGIHNYVYTDELLDSVEAQLNLDEN